jgi:hypothetical protein
MASLSTGESASKAVKVCVGKDLTVSRDATPTFTRTYKWKIEKSADKTFLDPGGTATYTMTVTEIGFTDSAWQVKRAITVTNPNDWESIPFNLADSVDNGGTCSIEEGSAGDGVCQQLVDIPLHVYILVGSEFDEWDEHRDGDVEQRGSLHPEWHRTGHRAARVHHPDFHRQQDR